MGSTLEYELSHNYVTTVRGSNPGKGKIFFFFKTVQTFFGAQPDSYSMGTGDLPEGLRDSSVKLTIPV